MKKITHEEARDLLHKIVLSDTPYKFWVKDMLRYISQQERQEKLLGLYRYLKECGADYDLDYDHLKEIEKEINELESEEE